MPSFRTGDRVFWNGVFPRPEMKGTVASPGSGTIRTPVRWDGREAASLEWNDALARVPKRKATHR